MAIRPFREQDRAAVLALLRDARAVDSPSHRLQVDEASTGSAGPGGVVGAALWVRPDAGDEPYLGSVIVPAQGGPVLSGAEGAGLPDAGGPVARWQQAYRLVAARYRVAEIALRYARRGSARYEQRLLLSKV